MTTKMRASSWNPGKTRPRALLRLFWPALFALLVQRTLSPCWAMEMSPHSHSHHAPATTSNVPVVHHHGDEHLDAKHLHQETHQDNASENANHDHTSHAPGQHAHASDTLTSEPADHHTSGAPGHDDNDHNCACCTGAGVQTVVPVSSVKSLALPADADASPLHAAATLTAPFELNPPFCGLYGREGPPGPGPFSTPYRSSLTGRAPPTSA